MISERIRQVRQALRLTQKQLGELAGISKSAVCAWEAGTSDPATDSLLELEKKRGVNPEWVKTGKGEMFHQQIGAGDHVKEKVSAYVVEAPFGYEKLNRKQKQLIESLIDEILKGQEALETPRYKEPATPDKTA